MPRKKKTSNQEKRKAGPAAAGSGSGVPGPGVPDSNQPPFPIDAYNAALAKEKEARDFAFLGVHNEICTIPILTLTLRMFVHLVAAQSPFLVGGRILAEHVAQFLWRVSPDYRSPDPNLRKSAKSADKLRLQFIKSIAWLPYGKARKEIDEYLDLIFLDSPPTTEKSKPASASFAASMIDIFAGEYGWTIDQILDSPLPQLYQLFSQIKKRKGFDVPVFNRLSDKIKKEWGIELEQWALQNKKDDPQIPWAPINTD